MWPYWLMFLVTALAALSARRHQVRIATGLRSVKLDGAWVAAVLVLTLLIGFRFEVGGDWPAYLRYMYNWRYVPIAEILKAKTPATSC